MAQSMSSHSTGQHGHGAQNHHPPQSINPVHHNHHPQHRLANHVLHSNSSSHNPHPKFNQDNDEEAIARKKKNADAQAAFRQRRSTYIKSLEETVTELKHAVTDMEDIVKITSNEVKAYRQQVEILESKLSAYENGEMKSGLLNWHCKCCHLGKNDQLPASSVPTPSTSAIPINSSTDCPLSSGPSTTNPLNGTSQEAISREWPPRQALPPIFQTMASSRPHSHNPTPQESSRDSPHSTKSPDYPRNILHHHSSSSLQNPSYPRSNCDLSLFAPFGATENNSIPHFYPVTEGNHGASAGQNSSPSGVCNSLDLGHHTNHLQPIMPHPYDRSPTLRHHNSLVANYSPLGPHQSFDQQHPSPLSSPRIWTSNNHDGYMAGSEPPSGSHLDGSPKHALYSIDGSVGDSVQSGFRMPHGISGRSIMHSVDCLPSLELRPVPQTYSMIPGHVSPNTDTFPGVGFKNRAPLQKRRREWGHDKFDSKRDNRETSDSQNSFKASGVGKLNGLPAKTALVEQVLLETTKTVSQAKEELQALTAATSTGLSVTHPSVSPNSTASNGFIESPDPSRDNPKFHRTKLNGPTSQLVSSASTVAPSRSHHNEQEVDHNSNHRYEPMMGN